MLSEPEAPRRVRARALTLFLLLAVALALAGCTDRRESGPERQKSISTWTAELPGRQSVLVTLPVHLDSQLPRAPGEYVLRTRVEVPEDMRARPLTLAVASLPALASFPEAPVRAKLSGRPLPQAIPLRTACPTPTA